MPKLSIPPELLHYLHTAYLNHGLIVYIIPPGGDAPSSIAGFNLGDQQPDNEDGVQMDMQRAMVLMATCVVCLETATENHGMKDQFKETLDRVRRMYKDSVSVSKGTIAPDDPPNEGSFSIDDNPFNRG